jgi:hypothetical protein
VNGLGAVSIDVHKKEREYAHLTLSDKDVVKYLILYRSKVDLVYGANININISQAGDIFEFNQELIVLYASLDKIISKLNLSDKEIAFLNLIFEGNTVADIIKVYKLFPKKTAYRTLDRLTARIVEENDSDWKNTMEGLGLINTKNNDIRNT